MVTSTRTGKYRYWQKSLVVAVVALILMGVGFLIPNTSLQWAAGAVFIWSAWYGVMSFFEYLDKD